MKFLSISSIINLWGLFASHAAATANTVDTDSAAHVADVDGPVHVVNSFPNQAKDSIESIRSADALRGSDGAGAEMGKTSLTKIWK